MPHYDVASSPATPEPIAPEPWQTGLRFWIRKGGFVWGCYWAVRSRWINAVERAAYAQRLDDWRDERRGW